MVSGFACSSEARTGQITLDRGVLIRELLMDGRIWWARKIEDVKTVTWMKHVHSK